MIIMLHDRSTFITQVASDFCLISTQLELLVENVPLMMYQ